MYLQARVLLTYGKRIPPEVIRNVVPRAGLLEIKPVEHSPPGARSGAFEARMVARFWEAVPDGARQQRQIFPPLHDPVIVRADRRGLIIAGYEWVEFPDTVRGMVRQVWWLEATSRLGGAPAP